MCVTWSESFEIVRGRERGREGERRREGEREREFDNADAKYVLRHIARSTVSCK